MTQFMLFQGPGFVLQVPTNWLIVSSHEYQASFIGPKIGDAHAGFAIAIRDLTTNGRTFAEEITATRLEQEAQLPDYVVVEEKDLSQQNYAAFHRVFRWYNPRIDMLIFQRQVFILTDLLYVLIASQPNHERLNELDQMFVQMINSFRVGEIQLP